MPKDVLAVNKFGESGSTNFPNLGESAIVYVNGNAYLLTVFVRGKDIKTLPIVLGKVSSVAFKFMSNLFN